MVRYGLSEKKHFEPLMRSLKENPGLTFGVDDFHEKVNDGKDYFLLRYEDKLLALRVFGSVIMCWDTLFKVAYYAYSRFASIEIK